MSCFTVNEQLVAAEIVDAEAVIINLSNGMYYTLVGTGAEIWSLIEARQSLDAIRQHLKARYDVASIEQDLDDLLSELMAESLIIQTPAIGAMQCKVTDDFGPYAKPTLTHYVDMKEVLALDPPLPELSPRKTG